MTEPQFGVRIPSSPPAVEVSTELVGEPAVSESKAMGYLGWTLIFLAFAPPISLILWRIATMPWGDG